MQNRLPQFLDFSAEVTCFTRFELFGTGQAEAYFGTVERIVGPVLGDLLAVYGRIGAAADTPARSQAIRRQILGDERLGPVARAIIKLWYIGIWYELPQSWTDAYGALPGNTSFVVSPASYAEGLLWVAIGVHPPGAKAPGYASWAGDPEIPEFASKGTPATRPTVTQTEPGHLSPHHAGKPQHPPPSTEGPPR